MAIRKCWEFNAIQGGHQDKACRHAKKKPRNIKNILAKKELGIVRQHFGMSTSRFHIPQFCHDAAFFRMRNGCTGGSTLQAIEESHLASAYASRTLPESLKGLWTIGAMCQPAIISDTGKTENSSMLNLNFGLRIN